MTQPWLVGGYHGLWNTVLDNQHNVDHEAWQTAVAAKQHVGTCRRPDCGGQLVPGVPHQLPGGRWQYPAVCTVDGCGYEAAALGPQPAKG